jgi:hypothetical protein
LKVQVLETRDYGVWFRVVDNSMGFIVFDGEYLDKGIRFRA